MLNQEDKINESNILLANIYWRLFKDGIELINNATYKNYVRIEKDKNLNLQEKEGRPKNVNLHVKIFIYYLLYVPFLTLTYIGT